MIGNGLETITQTRIIFSSTPTGITLSIGAAMPGIPVANNLVIDVTCDHIIKLTFHLFQSGYESTSGNPGTSMISYVIYLKQERRVLLLPFPAFLKSLDAVDHTISA